MKRSYPKFIRNLLSFPNIATIKHTFLSLSLEIDDDYLLFFSFFFLFFHRHRYKIIKIYTIILENTAEPRKACANASVNRKTFIFSTKL